MPNPNPGSSRISFQWKYVDRYLQSLPKGGDNEIFTTILNIGCSDDPAELGDMAWHLDIDDWSYNFSRFIQADAHNLFMIPDLSFDVVIMGDIIEHLYDPWRAIQEAARVCRGVFLMTIFEEWTLPGYGQFIDVGAVHGDEASQKLGYANREEYQTKTFPKRIGVSDDKVPHLVHINQFTDDDIRKFVEDLIAQGWTMIEYSKAYEATFEKHPWYNWLIALSRGVPV